MCPLAKPKGTVSGGVLNLGLNLAYLSTPPIGFKGTSNSLKLHTKYFVNSFFLLFLWEG